MILILAKNLFLCLFGILFMFLAFKLNNFEQGILFTVWIFYIGIKNYEELNNIDKQ